MPIEKLKKDNKQKVSSIDGLEISSQPSGLKRVRMRRAGKKDFLATELDRVELKYLGKNIREVNGRIGDRTYLTIGAEDVSCAIEKEEKGTETRRILKCSD